MAAFFGKTGPDHGTFQRGMREYRHQQPSQDQGGKDILTAILSPKPKIIPP